MKRKRKKRRIAFSLLKKELLCFCHKKRNSIQRKKVNQSQKDYIVTVNGVSYEVIVEKKGAGQGKKLPAGVKKAKAGVEGNISRIDVKVGDSVKRGETLLVLKAMNMEIPVVAFANGVIADILVHEKQNVKTGEILVGFHPI